MCQILNFQLSQRHGDTWYVTPSRVWGCFQSQHTVAPSMTCKALHQVGSRTRWSPRRSAQLSLGMGLQETKTLKQNPNHAAFQTLLGFRIGNRARLSQVSSDRELSAHTHKTVVLYSQQFQEQEGLQQEVPERDWTQRVQSA